VITHSSSRPPTAGDDAAAMRIADKGPDNIQESVPDVRAPQKSHR
jgi:hypothetical protein